jgi:hypothetical protein
MASEAAIQAAIESLVSNYSRWTIGITDDPERKKSEQGNILVWREWYADTETEVRNVESYFIAKGMERATDGGGIADCVYIYL